MTPDEFWSRVDRSVGLDECWPWPGRPNSTGYGRIGEGGRLIYAHRRAFELANGGIPPRAVIDHKCRNRMVLLVEQVAYRLQVGRVDAPVGRQPKLQDRSEGRHPRRQALPSEGQLPRPELRRRRPQHLGAGDRGGHRPSPKALLQQPLGQGVMTTRVWIVSANIGRGYQPGEAKDNFLRVRRGFHTDPVVGWQEVDEADAADEHAILEHTFGAANYCNVGFDKAVPISVPAPWTVVAGTAVVTHACKWLAHATPDRWIVEVVVQHPDLTEPVRFANGHYPLARLGGKEGRARWADCEHAWETRAIEWHRSGITTLTTRDTNRLRNMPPIHPSERQLLPNAISRITVVPGSVTVQRVGTRDVNLTIDGHSARGVELALSVQKEEP